MVSSATEFMKPSRWDKQLGSALPYAQSVNSSMVKAQESMLKAILRNGSSAVN
jgi:hypothetical protein